MDYSTTAVEFGHRLAGIGIGSVHSGHALVVCVAGAGFAYSRVTTRTSMNTDAAMIKNAMTLLMNDP